jgi:NAD(P)-dependent dehydrogenase (short-subunit alcohol dehydrogenase family)
MGVLDGKAVVITGSGRGIGAACARGCARQGAAVVVNDLYPDEVDRVVAEIEAEGGRAVGCVADVTDWDDAGRLIGACTDAFGKIDGLVNNAALFNMMRIDEFDPVKARAEVAVNVLGPLFCTARAAKVMLAQGSGSLVQVTSGAHLGMEKIGVYGATKGAVASMVYTWAIELAGTGVRINAISPIGATTIGFSRDAPAPAGYLDKLRTMMQPPEANSPLVEYLLSDLSRGVHGQLVRIDRDEVQLYTHPALLAPAAVRPAWTAEEIARVFDTEFKGRLVPCGAYAMREGPVPIEDGFDKRGYVRAGEPVTAGA